MNNPFTFEAEPFQGYSGTRGLSELLDSEYEAEVLTSSNRKSTSARKYPPFSLEPIIQRALGRAPKQEMEFFDGFSEVEGELTGDRLTKAVEANRRLARQMGWACVVGGRLQLNEAPPRPKLYELLGLGASPSEEDFAKAVERFQQTELRQRSGDGQLGPNTWNQLRRRNALDREGVPPGTRFAPFSKSVFFGGRKLGILEKTRAYEKCFFDPIDPAHPVDPACRAARRGVENERGGAILELGFRVTDMDAVRRAGFVDGYGEDFFRWVQVVEFITVPTFSPPPARALTFVRRASRVIDPTELLEKVDLHPYYWDEVSPSDASDAELGLNVDNWINRRAANGVCYDLIFFDSPRFLLTTVSPPRPWTRPGSHAYFNFELALVGVRPGPPIQNFVLATVLWGYDIFMKGGQPTVDLNGLHPGKKDGSPFFKQVLKREFNRDDVPFPGHCMAGAGYNGRASCRR